MNFIRTSFALRAVTVTVAFFSWVALSNHCALAEMLAVKTAPIAKEERGCCKHQPAPAKDEKPRPSMLQEGCKSLIVVPQNAAKLPVATLPELITPPVGWLVLPVRALTEEDSAAPPTGPPPDVPAFAELVLNRSLHSHAPPLAA